MKAPLLALAIVAVTLFGPPVLAQAPQAEIRTEIIIPGQTLEETAEGFARGKVRDLADYLGVIYNFLISVVGVAAAAMMMVGGYQYLTAGGNKATVDAAMERIRNAIIGLVLALASFTILNTINPELVNLRVPGVRPVRPEPFPAGVRSLGLTCDSDADCKEPGYRCRNAGPSGPGKSGKRCAKVQVNAVDNSDCDDDSQCTSKKCLKDGGDVGVCSSGQNGAYCLTQEDCRNGMKCVEAGSRSFCSTGEDGSFCENDTDCRSGMTCRKYGNTGKCSSGSGGTEGDPCRVDQDCKNYNIKDGDESLDDPKYRCLKPSGDFNCPSGQTPENAVCWCHWLVPATGVPKGSYCYSSNDCGISFTYAARTCTPAGRNSVKAYGICN